MGSKRSYSFKLARIREGVEPFRLHFFSTLGSTNSHAAAMRRRGELFAPAVILTSRQTAGRGRGSNTWFAGRGNLTVTFVLPVEEHLMAHQLPLVAGLAVRGAAEELSGSSEVQLKWPNDLLWQDRKLAGLLCERANGVDLVGLGLNVNLDPRKAPKELRERVTSLAAIAGRPFDLTDVLIAAAGHLRRTLMSRNSRTFAAFLREYDRHHALVGRTVTIGGIPGEASVTGRCAGLDEMGRLLVRDGRRTHAIIAGHVEMR